MSLTKLKADLKAASSPEKKLIYQRFFKTAKGQYGEGDVFIGVTVPDSRKVAKKYQDMKLPQIQKLLMSKIHEERLVALLILVEIFESCSKHTDRDRPCQKDIYDFYIKNTKRINNWDLVDLSASKIVGAHLFDKDRQVLYTLAESKSLWERRIAIIASFYFIKKGGYKDTLKLSGVLLYDDHDLIHKAVGWMLREVGKKDQKVLEKFLKKHYQYMPRTMLRYSIERFPENLRQKYLKGRI